MRYSCLCLGVVAIIALAVSACSDDERQPVFTTQVTASESEDQKALRAEIAQLAKSKDPANIEATAQYEQAKNKLIARGATIENNLIEAVLGSDDWGVRLGAIEVLKATGTKQCVDALISALGDAHPLVSLNACYLLRALVKHQEIPEPGRPIGTNGLPPVPGKKVDDLALDADEKLWAEWHAAHKDAHRAAFTAWWAANKNIVKVE